MKDILLIIELALKDYYLARNIEAGVILSQDTVEVVARTHDGQIVNYQVSIKSAESIKIGGGK